MASAKGGSGKTLITATFATFLAHLGKKVLIVDTDASTNGLSLLYIKEVKTARDFSISKKRNPIGVYEWKKIGDEFQVVKLNENLSLIPANYEFIDLFEDSWETYQASLMEIKVYFSDKFDYIFFDAQAGSDRFAKIAMNPNITDEVIIVSEYDPLSAAGLERLKGLLPEELNYYRTWILINKILPEFATAFSDFLEIARYLSPIHWSADIVRAYARRQVYLKLEHCDETTFSIAKTLESFLGDEIKNEISQWYEEQDEKYKLPIKGQIESMKNQIEKTEDQIKRLEDQFSKPLGTFARSFQGYDFRLTFIIVSLGLFVYFSTSKFIDGTILGGVKEIFIAFFILFILVIINVFYDRFIKKYFLVKDNKISDFQNDLEILLETKSDLIDKLEMDTQRLIILKKKEKGFMNK